ASSPLLIEYMIRLRRGSSHPAPRRSQRGLSQYSDGLLGSNERHTLFTWTAQKDFAPLQLAGGRGAWFWDRAGRRYLDLASVAVSANAGHNHPRILAAMRAQIDTLAVAGPAMTTTVREEAGERLARVTPPGLGRFLFTLGGADANEHAIKMAFLVTGRRKVLCRNNSYHGATLGALSFSDDPRAAPFRPGLPGVIHVKDPYCFRCPWQTTPDVCARPCADHVEETIMASGPETIAAVLMETVPGTNGGYFPPPDYYRRVREICDRHGILLILDEVLTGFGRTGSWFAIDGYGALPDMMTMGKGITSGHAPLGAVAVSEAVARHFESNVLATGLTHVAHPVSLAAALGNLEAFAEEGLVERSRSLGDLLASRLEQIKDRHAEIGDARSSGLYGCLEFEAALDTGRLKREALALGIHLLARGRCLFIAPPLVISEEDLLRGLDLVEDLINRL
ncbi:MAG TPA: aminotransferase class III-fold pyridoxal phosphate-dependent enzyme, partial [Candidatus Polarisedimenticolia bacterium]|nr:aminotransferase class III-fold pyridoxal phosphate-dependent enzyme [Candidatus Polarisedimenticolia bacterium]